MIKLRATVYILGAWHQAEILEQQELNLVVKVGNLTIAGVPLCNVQNVALVQDNEILQNFGKPDYKHPETIAYMMGWNSAYSEAV